MTDFKMRVNFILPFASKTGGVIVALEHARRLAARGHVVRVYHPVVPYFAFFHSVPAWRRPVTYARALLAGVVRGERAFSWHDDPSAVTQIPWISDRFVEDGDVVIATAWPTAYSVSRLHASKGRKAYFIQHYEVWSGARDRVDGSYRLPLGLLTIAPWLTALMRDRFGRAVVAEIHNGIDTTVFRPDAGPVARPLTVLMMHHEVDIKGIPDGLAVLRRLHEAHPDVRFRLFGMPAFPEAESWMEHVRDPSRDQLVRLYQEADVFLSPSLAEGWHLPPMEAMACGCAVVATRVGCIPVLERDGNLLSVEPGDRDGLFGHVDVLLRNPALRREVASKGLTTIKAYGWDAKAREFENAIVRIAGGQVDPNA